MRTIVVLALLGLVSCAKADVLIDNFERTNAPAPWSFYNGAEFPGATGSLTVGAGHSGQGAHLAYNLSQGGHYVSANLTLPGPITLAAIITLAATPPSRPWPVTPALLFRPASSGACRWAFRSRAGPGANRS